MSKAIDGSEVRYCTMPSGHGGECSMDWTVRATLEEQVSKLLGVNGHTEPPDPEAFMAGLEAEFGAQAVAAEVVRQDRPANVRDAMAELNDPLGHVDEDEEAAAVVPDDREMFTIPSGKYKGITLPRMIGVKPSYYDKVMALKEEILQDPEFHRQAGTIAQTYAALRREAEAAALVLSEVKLRLTAVMLLMIDQFENERETGLTLRNGDKVRWNPEPHLVVTDKEAHRQWCLKQGLERDMVLPWGKANKLAKEMLLDGRGEAPGAECFMRPKVSFTKGDK